MSIIRFHTYSMASKGMKALRSELKDRGHNAKALRRNNSRYIQRSNHLVINWGMGVCNAPLSLLNNVESVNKARRKDLTFNILESNGLEEYIPISTTSPSIAKMWLREGAQKVYIRMTTRGMGGEGIIVAKEEGDVIDGAPLYVKGIPNITREIRVHVFDGSVIDFAQKKRMTSETREERGIQLNPDIKNLENGYIFARVGVSIPQIAKEVAVDAMIALNLDFGAVDMSLSSRGGQEWPYILEINTAPGITESTVTHYANAIERKINGIRTPLDNTVPFSGVDTGSESTSDVSREMERSDTIEEQEGAVVTRETNEFRNTGRITIPRRDATTITPVNSPWEHHSTR